MKSTIFAVLVLSCAGGAVWGQETPQPQPAPGLTQQKPATTPSKHSSPGRQPTVPRLLPTLRLRRGRQLASFPQRRNDTFTRAHCRARRQHENAIEEYKAAIKEYPDYFKAHANLGLNLFGPQGIYRSDHRVKTAVRLQPDDADVHNNLGLALKHNGDLKGRSRNIRKLCG